MKNIKKSAVIKKLIKKATIISMITLTVMPSFTGNLVYGDDYGDEQYEEFVEGQIPEESCDDQGELSEEQQLDEAVYENQKQEEEIYSEEESEEESTEEALEKKEESTEIFIDLDKVQLEDVIQKNTNGRLYSTNINLPSTYSSVELGFVEKPVKQSGNSCWAHASASVITTSLLKQHSEKYKLNKDSVSVEQLCLQCYGDSKDPLGLTEGDSTYRYAKSKKASASDRGNPLLVAYELLNWRAPVYSTDSSEGERATMARVSDIRFIDVTSDQEVVKSLLMEYGSCTMLTRISNGSVYGINSRGAKFTPESKCSETSTNHAMAIVGWDDNYSKENFSYTPDKNGAWLVKNSYGTESGALSGNTAYDSKGYCWISYEDAYFKKSGRVFIFFGMDEAEGGRNNYGYDGTHNPVSKIDMVEKAGNVFTMGSEGKDEILSSVSFGTYTAGGSYNIGIYRLRDDQSIPWDGELITEVNGFNAPYPGIYKVDLKDEIIIDEVQRIGIVVTPVEGDFTVIADETNGNAGGFSFESRSGEGECFIRRFGEDKDVTEVIDKSSTLRIRAYTKSREEVSEDNNKDPERSAATYDSSIALVEENGLSGKYNMGSAIICLDKEFKYREGTLEKAYGDLIRSGEVYIKNRYTGHYEKLVEGQDYTITLKGNNKVKGTITVIYNGQGALKGSKKASIKIRDYLPLSDPAIQVYAFGGTSISLRGAALYTGQKIMADDILVKDTLSGQVLTAGKDYQIDYRNNKNPGLGTIIIKTVKGSSYPGQRTERFEIIGTSLESAAIKLNKTEFTYNGKAKTPSVTVYYNGKRMPASSYYTVYENNINKGTATVKVFGKGKYYGQVGGSDELSIFTIR
ncbi:MAG: hypothetical protein K5931_05480 [Lachnospiraceae bacterium]|nr:hypothetical protein [Lachnospiraceae bacterium]